MFKKDLKRATFLDPFNEFNEGGRECEVRTDPLTGRNSRILFFPLKELPDPDVNILLQKDSGFCPFCPENIDKITPMFNPDLFSQPRFRVGEAVCFPNAFPYDENGAVTVMTEKHFVQIHELNHKIVSDAVKCCVEFLKEVPLKQPEAVYQSINWNYLPLAGSSILHPHLQITASTVPTNYYSDVLRTMQIGGDDIFSRIAETEKNIDERYIDVDDFFTWMVAFAPEGAFDVMSFSHEYFEPEKLAGERLDSLVEGIIKIINFIRSKNILSFNMSIFFIRGRESFIPHMRICPRTSVPPLDTCEINYMKMLHNEPMSTMKPEAVAGELRRYWI